MAITHALARDELLRAARHLAPELRREAERTERERQLPDETVRLLSEAGILGMRSPRRHGGTEVNSRTVFDVIAEIARGDGSAAWNTAVWSISAWIAATFPDHVQEAVWADPGARVCSVLSPTGTAIPTADGVRISGRWGFVSGAEHSDWQVLLAMGPAPDGSQWPVMALVPMSQLTVIDDWHTAGLCGTGSVTTVAEDVLVPADRVLPMMPVVAGHLASEANADSPVYRVPLMVTGSAVFTGVAVGLARAALDTFVERLPGRKITYTSYERQSDAPITHLQLAEASLLVEEAEAHGVALADLVDRKGAGREEWSLAERAWARAQLGRVFGLAKDAVEIVKTASGASGVYTSAPIQRIERDIQTLNLHALMHPDTTLELYGRVLLDLPPNTPYL